MAMKRKEVLADLAKRHEFKFGAEIGVYKGETLFHLLNALPSLRMIGVDPWKRHGGFTQDKNTGVAAYQKKPMEEIGEQVIEQAKIYGGRAKIIAMPSIDAAKLVKKSVLDFVFIDADHSTESVLADIAAWAPKIRTGGFLTGHDANWPSVQRAINEAAPGWKQYPANIWIKQV